jgi:ribosomal protein L37E
MSRPVSPDTFDLELTDIPRQLAARGHKHRTTAYGLHHPACLACGATQGFISVKGFCSRCDYPIPPWRRWRVDVQGQPPFYEPSRVSGCTDRT